MASLGDIRNALRTTIEANIDGLKVYPRIPGTAVPKALVVRPATADFYTSMGRGNDTWTFDLQLLISAGDLAVAQTHLDEYIDGGGEKSIRKVIFDNRTLGLDDTDASIAGVSGYGSFEAASYDHIGAALRLVVYTKPA